jgi:hypothetical protein
MRTKIQVLLASVFGLVTGFAAVASATTPYAVDHNAEAQNLFNEYGPTAVAVTLTAAGFYVTMKLLGAVIRRVGGLLGGLRG